MWTTQKLTIELTGKFERGYVVETVGLKPSESLAELKCFTQAKIELQNVIRGKIEESFKDFFDYTKEIEPHREKVKLFRGMMREISVDVVRRLSDRIELESVYIDRRHSVLFCRISVNFDEVFYITLRDVSLDLIKTNYYKQIYNERVPKMIEEHIERKLREIRGVR